VRGDLFSRCAGLVLCDFDLDVAEVALPGYTFALLFVGVVGLGRAGGSAFEAAVVVVRDEGLLLVVLGGAVGVDVVDVREVDLESTSSVNILHERLYGLDVHTAPQSIS
jgi:hypothetical protein